VLEYCAISCNMYQVFSSVVNKFWNKFLRHIEMIYYFLNFPDGEILSQKSFFVSSPLKKYLELPVLPLLCIFS